MAFVRVGECNRCGDCCVGDPFLTERSSPESPDCEHYDRCGSTCRVYGDLQSKYGQGCDVFPDHPDQLRYLPNCSFRFEEVGDGN